MLTEIKGDPVELKWNRKDLESLEKVLKITPGRQVAIQAGGCLGVFARRLAQEFATVYTFEPSPDLFPQLVANVPEKNVIKLQAALGEVHELVNPRCEIRPNDGKTVLHPGMTFIDPTEVGVVPTFKIDDLCLYTCDLLYLDVEGYEFYALKGARQTILRCKPVITLEMNRGLTYNGIEHDTVRFWLENVGYKFHSRHRSDEVWVGH